MSNYDWSRFTQRISINAPIEKLYKAFATRSGIENWFLRMSEYTHPDGSILANDEFIKAGDTYKWLWYGWPDTVVETGAFLKANDKNELQFVFGKAGTVTVKIYTAENEIIVELTQEDIQTDDYGRSTWHLGCSTGWVFYLTNLKSLMEGGIDLRNKNEKLQGVLNA